jgi:hypothetical protein
MKNPAWPFVAPLLVFMLCLAGEGYFPDRHYLLYPVKTLLVAVAIAWGWRRLPSFRPGSPLLSLGVGILGVALWVGLDPYLVHYAQPLVGRNPFQLYPAAEAWVLFSIRLAGPEWPLGLIVGVLYGLWFIRTKKLGDIMLAHGVTNALLALYCLVTNDWHFLSIVAPKP